MMDEQKIIVQLDQLKEQYNREINPGASPQRSVGVSSQLKTHNVSNV